MAYDPEFARRFGLNLRKARKRVGLSQEEVGFRASLHRIEVGLLERGARMPRVDTLVKVAAAVGVRIDCALLAGITWNSGKVRSEAGAFTFKDQSERRRETLERAAEFRARQSETVDAVQLVREGREELDRRTERWKEGEGK